MNTAEHKDRLIAAAQYDANVSRRTLVVLKSGDALVIARADKRRQHPDMIVATLKPMKGFE